MKKVPVNKISLIQSDLNVIIEYRVSTLLSKESHYWLSQKSLYDVNSSFTYFSRCMMIGTDALNGKNGTVGETNGEFKNIYVLNS